MAIRKCNGCKPHQFQDKVYGVGQRVFTVGTKKEHKEHCTVCGNEHKVVAAKK